MVGAGKLLDYIYMKKCICQKIRDVPFSKLHIQLKKSIFTTSQDVSKVRDFPALDNVEEFPLCVWSFQAISVGNFLGYNSEHSSEDPHLKGL